MCRTVKTSTVPLFETGSKRKRFSGFLHDFQISLVKLTALFPPRVTRDMVLAADLPITPPNRRTAQESQRAFNSARVQFRSLGLVAAVTAGLRSGPVHVGPLPK
jgi:hypothetical protein